MKMKRSQLKALIKETIFKKRRREQALKILREVRNRNEGSVCIYKSPKSKNP